MAGTDVQGMLVRIEATTAQLRQELTRAEAATGAASRTIDNQLGRVDSAFDRLNRAASSAIGGLDQGMSLLAASVKAATGAFAAFSAGSFFKGALVEQEQLQRNLLRTQAMIKTTGAAAGFSARELHQQARDLALATLASTEGVMHAQQVLLSYSNVQGENFSRTIELANDLSTLMQGNLIGATETLAKALDAPAERLSSLTRIGFNFDEQQKAQIKTLVEQNQLLEAQAIILDTVASSFGGLARKEAEGLAGAQDTLGQMAQEASIAMADQLRLSDRAIAGYNAMSEVVVKLTQNVDLLVRGGEVLALVVGGRVVAALGASALSFAAAQIEAIKYQAALARMAGVSGTAAAAINAKTAAVRASAGAMALLGGPLGVATLAAGALYLYARDAGEARLASEFLGRSNDELVSSFQKVSEQVQGLRLERLREELRSTVEDAKRQADALKREFDFELRGWGITALSQDVQDAMWLVSKSVSDAKDGIDVDWLAVIERLRGTKGVSAEAIDKLVELAGSLGESGEQAAELSRILNLLEGSTRGAADAQRDLAAATTDAAGATYLAGLQKRVDLAGQLTNEQRVAIEIAKGYAGALSETDQQAALSNARLLDQVEARNKAERERAALAARGGKDGAAAAKREADELQRLLDKLLPADAAQRQNAESAAMLDAAWAAGKISAEQYTATMSALWDAQNRAEWDKQAKAQEELNKALKASADMLDQFEDRLDPAAAATRKYNAERARLNEIIKQGGAAAERARPLLAKLDAEQAQNMRRSSEWAQWTESALERVDGAFADAWKNIGDGFDGFKNSLTNAFRQMLAELAHMAITRPIVLSIGAALGVGGSPQALAAGGSGIWGPALGGGSAGGGSLYDIFGAGKSLYSLGTSGFGQAVTAGWNAGSGLWGGLQGATTAGWQYGSNAMGGMLGGAAQGGAGVMLDSAGNIVNHGLGGVAGSGMSAAGVGLAGLGGALYGYGQSGWKGAATGGAGAAVGAIIGNMLLPGIGGFLGSALGGWLGGSLFGGDWITKDAGLALQVRSGDMQGFNYEFQKKKGGLFGSNKKRYRYSAMSGDQAAAFDEMFAATTNGVFDAMSALGIDVSEQVLLGLNVGRKHFSSKSKKLEEDIAKWFGGVADKAATLAIGRNRELAGLTFEQLAELATTLRAVNASLETLNLALFDASPAGAKLAKQLQEMAGGMEQLATLQGAYYDAYFSDAEKAADLQGAMLYQFGELGLTLPATTAGFRALVEAQDLATESGQATYLALLAMAPQMQSLVSALNSVGAAAAQLRDSALSSLMGAYNAESQALATAARGFDALAVSLASFRGEVGQSLLALDGPLIQLDAVRRQFAAVSASAAAGDAAAMADLPAVGRQFAQAALAGAASREEYARELAGIQAATLAAEDGAIEQRDVALEQLATLEEQLTALGVLNASVLSVAEALAAYQAADAELQQALRDQLADGFGALSAAVAGNDPAAVVAAVRAGFELLDADMDGLLTFDELSSALAGKASDEQLLAVIAALDANGDGVVSAIEAQQQAAVERLEYVAGQLDLNRNGTISGLELLASRYALGTDALAAELKTQMTDLRLKTLTEGQLQAVLDVPAEDIAALLAVADANHDAVLTQTELDRYRNQRIVDLLIESGQLREQIGADFALIDSNLDGKLTASELQKYLQQEIGVVASNDGLKALIKSVDDSGNGTIERLDLIAAEVKRQNAIDIANLIGEADAGKISDNALGVFGAMIQTATPNYGGYAGVSEAKLERALAAATGLDRSEFSALGFADLAALAKNLGLSKGTALSLGENVIDGVIATATVDKLDLAVARLLGDAITARTANPAPAATNYSNLTEDKMEKGVAALLGVSQDAISLLTKAQLDAVAKSLKLDASYFPAFARGGLHSGGIRLVGEQGPELEVTGPSRIYSASQTAAMLGGGAEAAAEVRTLRAAVNGLSDALRSIAKHTQQTAKRVEFLERWDYDGMPGARTA